LKRSSNYLTNEITVYCNGVFECYLDILAFAVISDNLKLVKLLHETNKFDINKIYCFGTMMSTNLLKLANTKEMEEYLLSLKNNFE